MKFKDGAYCGCNLFGFLNPRAHRAAQFWRQIEQERKRPLKMMRILGWRAVLGYLMGRTSLDQGLEQISRKLQIRARAILLPFPEAAVDVDTIDHWQFVQKLVAEAAFLTIRIGKLKPKLSACPRFRPGMSGCTLRRHRR